MQPGICLESMILHAFVRKSICSHILYYSKHHGAEKWDLEFGSNTTGFFFKHQGKKLKTHEANDPTCFCLTEYLQPYISPNVFTFPSMAVCVFWIYGKGKYL